MVKYYPLNFVNSAIVYQKDVNKFLRLLIKNHYLVENVQLVNLSHQLNLDYAQIFHQISDEVSKLTLSESTQPF